MSAQNAKDAADDFVANLPPPDESKGEQRKFQLVTFASEEDCRFFYPRRALDWQRQVNTYISRALRERRIRVQRIGVTPGDYITWRSRMKMNLPDTPERRRKFVDGYLKYFPAVE